VLIGGPGKSASIRSLEGCGCPAVCGWCCIFFLASESEFGPQRHPLEPWWLKFHGAFAFAAIWLFGLLWGKHVCKAWPYGKGRWSGAALAGLLFWLMLSGYLLYYLGGEGARSIVSVLHWGIGFAAPLLLLWHRFDRGKSKMRHESFPTLMR
jgi:hypothetical protein